MGLSSWPRMMRQGHDALVNVGALVATASFAALAILTLVDVITRNIRIGTFGWALEGSEYLLMIGCFVGVPWVLRRGGHVAIDVVVQILAEGPRRKLERAADVVGLLICLPLTVLAIRAMLSAQASGALVYKTLVFPEWYLLVPLTYCVIMMTSEFALRCAGRREVAA